MRYTRQSVTRSLSERVTRARFWSPARDPFGARQDPRGVWFPLPVYSLIYSWMHLSLPRTGLAPVYCIRHSRNYYALFVYCRLFKPWSSLPIIFLWTYSKEYYSVLHEDGSLHSKANSGRFRTSIRAFHHQWLLTPSVARWRGTWRADDGSWSARASVSDQGRNGLNGWNGPKSQQTARSLRHLGKLCCETRPVASQRGEESWLMACLSRSGRQNRHGQTALTDKNKFYVIQSHDLSISHE